MEMWIFVLECDEKIGGYVGLNLGIMELMIVFYYVFDFLYDKVIWDVFY